VRSNNIQASQEKTKNISLSSKAQAEIKKGSEAPPPKPTTPTSTPSKSWDPQKEIQSGGVSGAKNRFLQQNTPEPKPQNVQTTKKWEPPKPQNVPTPPQPPREQPTKVEPPPPKVQPPPPKVEPPPEEYPEEYPEETYEEPQIKAKVKIEYQEEKIEYQEEYQESSQTCEALYEYVAQNEGELSFYAGDIITVLDTSSEDGWWQGIAPDGSQGYFPSNFVQMKT